jgi:flagellar motor protein MotB
MAQIKSTLEDEQKTKELSQAFAEKGISNPDSLLAKNAEKIVDKFNELAKDKNITYRVSQTVVNNLVSLNRELKKGYALKKADVSTDTIKGVEQKKIVTIVDTIDVELNNDNLFVTGDYMLSDTGVSLWNKFINTIKSNGGKVISANIESSTDSEPIPKYKTDTDKTGNIKLAEMRTQQMVWIINSLDKDVKITSREIPNNGADVVSSSNFMNARNNKAELEALRQKTAEFRYVKVSLTIEFSQEVVHTIKPEEIVKKYRFDLVKVIDTNEGSYKRTKTFKNKKLKCNSNKSGSDKCFTF